MKVAYRCEKCGKDIIITDGEIPICCNEPMREIPLDVCTQPAHAEHTRPMKDEEPCDNGRSG
ncbi:MAG: hypothetical protein JSV67_07790 [Thermoplasmatales archaeon]|jgi:hypothetical protein|nr:MAG: hypothetical protein JSV67_07790 [Thermoplasmatales archaeon]